MSTQPLPHDPYIEAVVDALTAAGIAPDDHWTSDAEINRYTTGPDAGCTTMLDAYIDWDTTPGHEHGIALLWEQPAEQWMWAPRADGGHLDHDPEFLPLNRWADPAAVVTVVRILLAGLEPHAGEDPRLWSNFISAGEAVAAWEAENDGEDGRS
ncbi:hypothetical protein QD712_25560 [Streptomyces acidiscabies]|uniref:hypothetical protein n=1 Tax=Streptomyces acidiscabies TaxID=42234 RepID=UPI0030D46BE1